MVRDLKLLSKDRREEILNSNVYFDVVNKESGNVLILTIDKNLPLKHFESHQELNGN